MVMDDWQQCPLYSLHMLFASGDSEGKDTSNNTTLSDRILRNAEKNRMIKIVIFLFVLLKSQQKYSRIQYQAVL